MLQNNGSIIVGWIKGKDGLKYTIGHIMTYFLLCYIDSSSIILLIDLEEKMY